MDPITNHPLYKKHNLDTAINSTWEFYKKYFFVLFGVSLIISLFSQYVSTMINKEELQSITDPVQMLQKMTEFIKPFLIISLVNLYFTTVIVHYIVNKPLNPGHSIFLSAGKAFIYYIPLLILMVLLSFFGSIAVIVGVFALIIGAFFAALYILTLYLFILPVLVVEGTNISNAITRTFILAHRRFWQNIGWVSVLLLILIVISIILSSIIMIPFAGDFIKNIFNPGEATSSFASNPVYLVLSALVGAITFPILPIFSCVLYFNAKASEDEKITIQPVVETEYRPTVEDLYAKPIQEEKKEEDKKLNE
ncbi:MAG TPA: hypothetical protein VHO68_15320 [Bacteroidales bacterium]|nr:hypothetical protein [Bacteroidales bacterium]